VPTIVPRLLTVPQAAQYLAGCRLLKSRFGLNKQPVNVSVKSSLIEQQAASNLNTPHSAVPMQRSDCPRAYAIACATSPSAGADAATVRF